MDKPPLKSSLLDNSVWYVAAAGATIPAVADAQIIYTDPPDCVAQVGSTCDVDFDQDGDPEIILVHGSSQIYGSASTNDGPDVTNINVTDIWHIHGLMYNVFQPLSYGEHIGFVNDDLAFEGGNNFYFYDGAGPWFGQEYVGVGFTLNGDPALQHFGWARVYVVWENFTLKSFAYQAIPGGSIQAGQTEQLLLLAGVLNETTLPSEGGLLVYDAEITNASPDDATLDVWIDTPRGTIPELLQLLGTVAVPAGNTAAQVFTAAVPADAPAGVHVVTFYIGDFAAQTFVASQSFEIRKATATAAEPNTTPGMHTLSAVYPNPSDGRSRFTLEVAQSQAVRIAVYDALGREVALLHNGALAAGTAHAFAFERAGLPGGVYVVRVTGERFEDFRTVTLLK